MILVFSIIMQSFSFWESFKKDATLENSCKVFEGITQVIAAFFSFVIFSIILVKRLPSVAAISSTCSEIEQ